MSKRPSASTATPGHQQRATLHGNIHLNLDQDLWSSLAHSSFSKLVINQYPATFQWTQWTPEIMGFQTSWFLCVPSPTSQLKQPAVASWPWRLAFPGLRGHHPEPQATRAPNCHGYLVEHVFLQWFFLTFQPEKPWSQSDFNILGVVSFQYVDVVP